MSTSHAAAGQEEDHQLYTVPGEVATQNTQAYISNGPRAASFCDDQHHRKLAICSIICGISCIGIKALINSVKAEREQDPEKAAPFLKRAKKLGIISIVVWVSLLILTPILIVLVSYLLTLGD
ncbi:hypothetical protein VZT92_007213 [Zoarces viviparus]|uniref:Transmembrane protein 265 n=1 Tax=Zoarces viviparus TaxID=48416 RepID=A0AAW1FJQ2_ZOAVI